MRKRLDLQSLLDKCDKGQMTRFLRTRFTKDPNLATDFIVHFASTFDLEEDEFHHITRRIERLFSRRPDRMTARKANVIREHLLDLTEQTRDCISRKNFRQAYIIIAHVNLLIDSYLDRISENHEFRPLQKKTYELLRMINDESPAPSLKKKVRKHLTEIIKDGKGIPFYESENPYWILFDTDPSQGRKLSAILRQKITEWPEYKTLFLQQWVRIVIGDGKIRGIEDLILEHEEDLDLYHALLNYFPKEDLDSRLIDLLHDIYIRATRRSIKETIYQILQRSPEAAGLLQEMSLREFFESGDLTILDALMRSNQMTVMEIARWLERADVPLQNAIPRIHLYRALDHLETYDILKDQVIRDPDIFVTIRFLDPLYEKYPVELRDRMWTLIEEYLDDHFGLPAFNRVNAIIDELAPIRYERLQNFLLRKIRNTFGHRKHFQKRMKELAG